MQISGLGARAYPYIVSAGPDVGAVNVETLKSHLRIPAANCNQDEMLQLYLDAAIEFAEDCMGLALITRTYETYRDFFPILDNEGYYPAGIMPETFNPAGGNAGFNLRRGPVQSVTSVEYIPADDPSILSLIAASDYYLEIKEAGKMPSILAQPEFIWPYDLIYPREDSIKITFVAGFGDEPKNIPSDIRVGILEHAAMLFANRGDCSACGKDLPPSSASIYKRNKVMNL